MGKSKKRVVRNICNNHYLNLNTLLPEITCAECGKKKCLPWGTDLTNYVYQRRSGYKSGRLRREFYCSYSCMKKASERKR